MIVGGGVVVLASSAFISAVLPDSHRHILLEETPSLVLVSLPPACSDKKICTAQASWEFTNDAGTAVVVIKEITVKIE